MTTDEMLEILEHYKLRMPPTTYYELQADIVNFEEPTTKNNLGVDCIDRQATLDAIIKRLGIKNETYLLEAERTIYQQILAMPSVTPQEPKTGHWKWQTEDIYRCSECNEDIHVKEVLNVPQYEWCPMCGAKMVEPQESEDKG